MANGGVQIDPSVADLLQTEEGTAEFAELMAVVSLQQMGMLLWMMRRVMSCWSRVI